MARIYPIVFPHELTVSKDKGLLAELDVYEKLKHNLPDEWVVLYNQWRYHLFAEIGQNRKPAHLNYEADFIVLVPQKGYVVLEVKDWMNPETRPDGYWYRYDPESQKYVQSKKGSPLNQAFRACCNIHDELCAIPSYNKKTEHRCLAVLHGTSGQYQKVAYCEQDLRAARASKVPQDNVFDTLYVVGTDALDNIKDRIESLFINDVYFSEDDMELVRAYLFQCVRFNTDPVTCTRIMERAAAGIDSLLPRLETSIRGIHVSGCAGSGKTWMACKEAMRLRMAYPQKKILFLCYNRNLADNVRDVQLGKIYARDVSVGGNVQVATFHDIFRFLAQKTEVVNANPDAEEHLSSVFAFIEKNVNYRYDYIFVDEAQDIKDDWWDYVILPMKRQGGLLYAFSDSNQHIYAEGCSGIDFLPVRIQLDQNLRNACEIAQLSTASLPEGNRSIKALAFYTQGYKCYEGIANQEDRASKVRQLIDEILTNNPGVHKNDIVVLSPYIFQSSFNYLADVVDVPVEGESVEDVLKRKRRCCSVKSKLVYGETVKSFKGLEAPFVILTDVNVPREKSGFTPNDFYVACTRAKYGLYIVPTVEGEKYIRELEKTAANLPSPLD